jgi:hypothetical protein
MSLQSLGYYQIRPAVIASESHFPHDLTEFAIASILPHQYKLSEREDRNKEHVH